MVVGILTAPIACIGDSNSVRRGPVTRMATINYPTTLAVFVISACIGTSSSSATMTEKTSDPKPVDPQIDNSMVLNSLITSLVVTFDINDTKVKLRNLQIVKAPPRYKGREENEEIIVVIGTRKGKKVGSVQVPDERVNVEEKKGLVIMKKRTITALVPLPKRIDHVKIVLPGQQENLAPSFDVHTIIDKFCNANPQISLCHS